MQSRRPLEIKCAVILRRGVLPVRFFTHFNVGNWVAPLLQIRNLGNGILRCIVNQRDRDHGRQTSGTTARKEKIETYLRLMSGSEIGSFVPWVHGGAIGRGL